MAIREYNGNTNKYRAYFKYQNKQYSKTFKTKKEAHKWEIETKEALKSEDFTSPKLTYLIASNEYLDDYQARFQHNSYREKKCHLSEFYRYLGNDVELKKIDTHTCNSFILDTKKTLGSKSANRRLKSLKALWNWNKSRINSNPWLGINPYYEDEYKKYVPKKEDVHKVLDVANEWEKDLLYMLIYSGARLSEILNLTWDDVSLEAGSLQLWTRKRKGGSRQSRLIPIVHILMEILKRQQSENLENQSYVFINKRTGNKFTRNQPAIAKMLRRLCQKAEVEVFTFHAIRHYFSKSLLDSRNASIADIQLLLGHQRATTTDIYLRSISSQVNHLTSTIEMALD